MTVVDKTTCLFAKNLLLPLFLALLLLRCALALSQQLASHLHNHEEAAAKHNSKRATHGATKTKEKKGIEGDLLHVIVALRHLCHEIIRSLPQGAMVLADKRHAYTRRRGAPCVVCAVCHTQLEPTKRRSNSRHKTTFPV